MSLKPQARTQHSAFRLLQAAALQQLAPGWLEMMTGMLQFSSPFSTRISRSYRQWSSLLHQPEQNREKPEGRLETVERKWSGRTGGVQLAAPAGTRRSRQAGSMTYGTQHTQGCDDVTGAAQMAKGSSPACGGEECAAEAAGPRAACNRFCVPRKAPQTCTATAPSCPQLRCRHLAVPTPLPQHPCLLCAPDQQRHTLLLGAVADPPLHVVAPRHLCKPALQHRCKWREQMGPT